MQKTMMCLLMILTALALLASSVPIQTASMSSQIVIAPIETGVYIEDFTTYTAKDYTDNAEWNIWMRTLQLKLTDALAQDRPIIVGDGSGNVFIVWLDQRRGIYHYDIYAQKLDGGGNRLWEDDVRVNSDKPTEDVPAFDVAVDKSGNAVVIWKDQRNIAYDIYAQKLDGNGNKLWPADARVNSGSETGVEYSLNVAVDGSGNAIVLWDARNGNMDIYAQKLNGDGNRLWAADVRVNSDSGTAPQWFPVTVLDESGNAFVVWEDGRNGNDDVYAQKLDTNGNKLWTADVCVNSHAGTTDQESPKLGLDGKGNVFVAWRDTRSGILDYDIYAQKLDASGNRLWPADVHVNSDRPAKDYERFDMAVDWHGNAVVVWEDQRNDDGVYPYEKDIYAQKLDESGNKLWEGDVRVNSDSGTEDQESPKLSLDESGNAFVVWGDERNGNQDIYAQKLAGSGEKLLMADVRVNSGSWTAGSYPSVALDGNSNVFIAWDAADIFAQKLDKSGNKLWAVDVDVNSASGTADQEYPSVVLDWSGNAIVVWQDSRNGDYDIHAQKLDGDGNRLWAADVRVNSDSGTAPQWFPVTVLDESGNAFVVWEDGRNGNDDVYAQKLDTNGNKLWTADVRVNSHAGTTDQGSPAAAVDGSGNAVVLWDARNGNMDIYAQKLNGDGNKLWAADVRVNSDSGTADQYDPAVAMDESGNAIVVWQDERNGDYNDDVFAQRLDGSGNKLWAADVRVNSDSGMEYQGQQAVAMDEGGSAVITWIYASQEVYAQKLDASGNKLWTADVRVDSRTSFNLADTAVAVDRGGNAFVVWMDGTIYPDIYAQRLDGSGNRLWVADLRVNHYDRGLECQANAAVAVDGLDNAVVVWEDERNSNGDIYAQQINQVGSKGWLADLQVVYPDWFHVPSGVAQSRPVDTTADNIHQAILTANYAPNGGDVQFYLTNNGGTDWFPVTPGVTHVFTTTGSDLRWRAVLDVDPIWNRTPVVNSLSIEYFTNPPGADPDDYEQDDTCMQASPLQINGAVQAHTFHQPGDEDWAWFDVVTGTTYILQTAHAGPNADTVLELHDVCDHPILTDTNAFGHDARLVFTAPSDATLYTRVSNHDGDVYGEGTDYDLSVRIYHPNGLAVVVAGHNDAWQLQSNIDYAADQAYLTLLGAGFPKGNVRYLGPNPDRDVDGNGLNDDIAATATITNVRYAIQDWSREQGLALGVPFYVYLMDHGHYDLFLADGSAGWVTAPLLDLWLSNLEATTGADQITVIVDACKSGSFIDVTGPGPAEISGHNRVVVASTTSQANAYPSEQGSLFSDVFWTALGDNQDVWSAYQTVKAAVEARGLMQTPWLDDNGDAVADEQDGDLARGRGLAGVFGGSEPVIDWLTVGEVSESGVTTVTAQVRDDFSVMAVHVEVYPPGYEEPEGEPGGTPLVGVPTATLQLMGGDVYTATLTGLSVPGFYRVVGYAVDDEGNWALPAWDLVQSGKAVYLPLVLK